MRTLVGILAALACLVAAPAVHAQDADALNQAGMAAFSEGDFVAAAQNFANAYAADPDPIFRKSEAVAWFKAARCDEAITAANAFLLQWKGSAEESDEAASVLANCKVNLADQAMLTKSFELAERLLFEAESAARDTYTRDRISAARVELARLRQEEIVAAKDPDVVVPQPEPAREGPAVGAVVTLASGAGIVLVAAVLHVATFTTTIPNLERAQDGDKAGYDRLARRLNTARILVPTLYAIGGVASGLGVWMMIDRQPDAASARRSGASAGLVWSGHF